MDQNPIGAGAEYSKMNAELKHTDTGFWTEWPGQVVNGTFPLRRLLGSTRRSAVFLTEHKAKSLPDAAIKFVRLDGRPPEPLLDQWTGAATLDHPNLVRLFETGRFRFAEQEYVFVVMEYADQTLAEILRHRALHPDELLEMLVPTLEAMTFLHRRHLVHLQLKPSNVMAIGDQLKLTSDTIRPLGQRAVGVTVAYDPPELKDNGITTAGDVWSLGATMVEALTQRTPSGSELRFEQDLPGSLPGGLRDTVRRCLSLRHTERPSVIELRSEYKGGASSQPEVRPQAAVQAPPAQLQSPIQPAPSQAQAAVQAQPRPQVQVPPVQPQPPIQPAPSQVQPTIQVQPQHRPQALTPPTQPHLQAQGQPLSQEAAAQPRVQSLQAQPQVQSEPRPQTLTPQSQPPVQHQPPTHAQAQHQPSTQPPVQHQPSTQAQVQHQQRPQAEIQQRVEAQSAQPQVQHQPPTHAQVQHQQRLQAELQQRMEAQPAQAQVQVAQAAQPQVHVAQSRPQVQTEMRPQPQTQPTRIEQPPPPQVRPPQAHAPMPPPQAQVQLPRQRPADVQPQLQSEQRPKAESAAQVDALAELTPQATSPKKLLLLVIVGAALAVSVMAWLDFRSSVTPPAPPQPKVAAVPAPAPPTPITKPVTDSSEVPSRITSPVEQQPAEASNSVVNEVIPTVPPKIQRDIQGSIYVTVRALVDPAGDVTAVLMERPGPSKYFARLADNAAREWKFVPIEEDADRVWRLNFRFTSDEVTVRAKEQ